MVKLGFICEGETEKTIVESEKFKSLLSNLNLELVGAIDATGGGNQLPKNILPFHNALIGLNAEKIFILTDREKDPCITEVKNRIENNLGHQIIVSVEAIESWYLADDVTLSAIFRKNFHCDSPESTPSKPFDYLRSELNKSGIQGLSSSKIKFTKRMLQYGFDVANAAVHPECKSAKYFLNKLKEASQQ